MPVSFDHPWFLLGLLLLPLFWWVGKGSLADLTPLRRRISLGLRLSIVGALVLALAGANWVKSNSATCTLFVVDASYSLPRAKREQALEYVNQATREMWVTDRIGIVAFGTDARIAAPPMERGKIVADLSVPDGSQTNLARAITTALSTFPPEMAKRIVLVTDGNENAGSALEAARSAAAEDVPVDVIPLGSELKGEVTLDRMLTPPDTKRGEPFPLKVVATSLTDTEGTLRLYRNDKYIGEQKVSLKPGKNVFTLPQKADAPGFYTYKAEISVPEGQDSLAENNRAMSFVKVKGKPRILAVEGVPGQERFLTRALGAQQVDVDVRTAAQLPTQMVQLLNYDAVVLSDVPADALTQTQMRVLQAAVRDMGLGLTMVGGDNAFGAGGYFKTPIEEALPVDMDIRKMRRFPGVALALVVDKSGSMGSPQGAGNVPYGGGSGGIKNDISREAANRAVETLSAQDQIGVIAFDSSASVVVPLQYATDAKAIQQGIGTIAPGGGTEIPSGVEAAYEMLEKADAKIKHVILITDGFSNQVDYADQIARLKREKITLTAVVINENQGKYLKVMESLAKRTGGRFYLIQDVQTIPKIYTREVQTVSKPPVIEEPFVPRLTGPGSPILAGIPIESAPPLLGYDVVNPKPTAEVPLVSHRGDAILATWQYGLGKSVAFTSDAKARWAAQWVGWGSFGPFWAQALRWSLRRTDTGSYQTTIEQDGGRGRITIDAVDKEGTFVNFLDAKARVAGPDGVTQVVRLTQTGSGRYEGTFDVGKTGSYVATVTQKGADGKTRVSSAGLAIPYSPEYRSWRPNLALLSQVADVTGGKLRRDGESVFTDRRPARTPLPLALPLLLAALLLFPLDVATRRLMLSTTQAQEMYGEARAKIGERMESRRLRTRAEGAQAAAAVNRLLERKSRLQAEEDAFYPGAPERPEAPPPPRSVTWGVPPPSAPPPPSPPPSAADAPAATAKKPEASEGPPGGYRSRLLDAKRRAARGDDE